MTKRSIRKSALEAFTESVAKEVVPEWNIKFLIVAPGAIRTNFAGPSMKIYPRHAAYNVPTGPFNQLLQYMTTPGIQGNWGEAEVFAKLLFETVVGQEARPMPTRLFMGAEAIPLIKTDIDKTLKEMEKWKEETLKCSPKGGAALSDFA
jgi:NAD(P)-dependent dehydrogenase (short-subunit alcohol dehydrogenase family)